jgi:hypothetical protein
MCAQLASGVTLRIRLLGLQSKSTATQHSTPRKEEAPGACPEPLPLNEKRNLYFAFAQS